RVSGVGTGELHYRNEPASRRRLGDGDLAVAMDRRLRNVVERARSVAPPAESSIAGAYDGADLVDAFATTFRAGIPRDPDAVARAILDGPAWWVRCRLAARDMIVARFGLKTTGDLQRNARASGSIGFFPVLSRSENELVLGVDDRHLD